MSHLSWPWAGIRDLGCHRSLRAMQGTSPGLLAPGSEPQFPFFAFQGLRAKELGGKEPRVRWGGVEASPFPPAVPCRRPSPHGPRGRHKRQSAQVAQPNLVIRPAGRAPRTDFLPADFPFRQRGPEGPRCGCGFPEGGQPTRGASRSRGDPPPPSRSPKGVRKIAPGMKPPQGVRGRVAPKTSRALDTEQRGRRDDVGDLRAPRLERRCMRDQTRGGRCRRCAGQEEQRSESGTLFKYLNIL